MKLDDVVEVNLVDRSPKETPEKYLRKVLTEITNIEVFDPERFRQLLPWNIDLTS